MHKGIRKEDEIFDNWLKSRANVLLFLLAYLLLLLYAVCYACKKAAIEK